MRMIINCYWIEEKERTIKFRGDTFNIRFNAEDPNADFVVDVGRPFTKSSSLVAAWKAALITSEPWWVFAPDPNSCAQRYGNVYSHADQLSHLHNFHRVDFSGTWVTWEPGKPTKMGVSAIWTPKHLASDGYELRLKMLALEDQIKQPGMFYSEAGSWHGEKFSYPLGTKEPSFQHYFHVAIENAMEPHYHTEKIIDAFLCRCVPIYWGDPKIGDYFDANGIITLDMDHAAEQLNSLTEEDYTKRYEAIEINFMKAQRYRDWLMQILTIVTGEYKGAECQSN